MREQKPPSLPFETTDTEEQALWAALADLPRDEPPGSLRRGFYENLEAAGRPTAMARLSEWLGFGSHAGWVTAGVCAVLGFGISQALLQQETLPVAAPTEDARLAALEDNVALLNRELVLVRLNADSATTRLQGVVQATSLAASDDRITRALLATALEDRSLSVRSAAIDALGPQIGDEALGQELMRQLETAESPLLQLALVDLVLRHGNTRQVEQLLTLAQQERLHPDIATHVLNALGGQSA